MRMCEQIECQMPVWGTCKITREGYCKKHQYLRKDYNRDSIMQRAVKKQRENVAKQTQSKLRNTSYESDDNRDMVKAYKSKSELLREADRLFSLFIRNRDCDKNGNIACVCCGKIYNVEDKDNSGNKIVQCLHFIERDVYLLRFDEDFAAAGCTWCNKDMWDNKNGTAYRNFKNKMLLDFGQDAVDEAELAHRKINKITEQQLKTIIEHYSTN